MRYNKDSERGLTFDSVAVDLSNFPELRSNERVWDCTNGGWISTLGFNQFAQQCETVRDRVLIPA